MRTKAVDHKSKSILFQSYKHLIAKLEEKNRRHKLDIKNLQAQLEAMAGLDYNLGLIMQDFWADYSPKLQEWLRCIKQILSEIPAKIADLEKKKAAADTPAIKRKYQKLIRMQHERENRWRNVGAMIITKVLTLEDVTAEINNLQKTKQDSTANLNKMIREYQEYEKDLKETLKDYVILEEFETRVQQELDRAISDISPALLEMVNDKIVENIKAVVPRARYLLAEASSIESLPGLAGTKPEEIKLNQAKIVKNLQKLEVQSLQFKLKVEPFDGHADLNRLESKIDEVVQLLNTIKNRAALLPAKRPPSLPVPAAKGLRGSKKSSFARYREIVDQMGISQVVLEEIYPLQDDETNDFNAGELKKVLRDFFWDAGIRERISRHPRAADSALQYIFAVEMEKKIYMPPFWARRINFCRLIVHVFGASYFGRPNYKLADLYDYSRVAFDCLLKFLSRGKISKRLFRLISNSKLETLKIALLKNPRLRRDYFFEYQHTGNQDYINALANNVSAPARVLNNMVKNADEQNLELILKHGNATAFTKELIAKRKQEGNSQAVQ